MHAGQLRAYLIAQGHPVQDVSIGAQTDRTTWDVTFTPGVTPAQRAAVRQALQSLDPAVVERAADDQSITERTALGRVLLQAAAAHVHLLTGGTPTSQAQQDAFLAAVRQTAAAILKDAPQPRRTGRRSPRRP